MNYLLPPHNSAIHIWTYKMDLLSVQAEKYYSILSYPEQQRADRFLFGEDRNRFLSVHFFLRNVLGRYLHVPANDISFCYSIYGKPFLNKDKNSNRIYFNLSYRGQVALLGISNCKYTGVDIEKICDIPRFSTFAYQYLSNSEQHILFSKKTKTEQLSALFTFWAMKEALVKSIGKGLTNSLKCYDLSRFMEYPCNLPDFDRPNKWFIGHFSPVEGYKSAFAVRSNDLRVRFYRYEDK